MIVRCGCMLLRSNVYLTRSARHLHWKWRLGTVITCRAQMSTNYYTFSRAVDVVTQYRLNSGSYCEQKSDSGDEECEEDDQVRRYVVFDCDTGSDAAWSLLMLLKAEEAYRELVRAPGKFKILAVTCVHGTTDVNNSAKNTMRVLESVDRTDIPVYPGCAKPILPPTSKRTIYYHGRDGFGDLKKSTVVDIKQMQRAHAVSQMYRLVLEYPNMVDFILTGPLTNFAMCINMYGSCFLDKVGKIYIVGGNYKGKGNITRCGEFNFVMDPEAAHIVLSRVKKPVTILPWETCTEADMGLTLKWRFQELSQGENNALKLLNPVEKAIFGNKSSEEWLLGDTFLMMAYILPRSVKKHVSYHATVELNGNYTRGQMLIDHSKREKPNADMIMKVDRKLYHHIIKTTAELNVAEQMEDLLIEYGCPKN